MTTKPGVDTSAEEVGRWLVELRRCTCADFWKPYAPKRDPQCGFHSGYGSETADIIEALAAERDELLIERNNALFSLASAHATIAEQAEQVRVLREALEIAFKGLAEFEVMEDGEWGQCRDFPQLEADGCLSEATLAAQRALAATETGRG